MTARRGLRGWVDPRGRHAGMWTLVASRVAGAGLVGYLYLHLIVLSLLTRGPDAWDRFVAIATHPAFLALDVVLIAGVLVHAAHGVRIALLGSGLLAGARRAVMVVLSVGALAVGTRRRRAPVPVRKEATTHVRFVHTAARRHHTPPAWLWVVQVGTGLLLLVLLTAHMIAQHYVARAGLRTYAEVMSWIGNPLVFTVELAFLITVTWHALVGLHGIMLDFAPDERTERILSRFLVALGIGTVGYGTWLLVTLAAQS
jgi:succinate dehydrogenase cytochrome b subunit